jgi:hypothetical protein
LNKKIIFIPFTDGEGNTGERGDAADWEANLSGFTTVVYDGGFQPAVMQAGILDQIYIVGHGAAGDPKIANDTGSADLPYNTIADRLILTGLPKTYAGDIKIYACRGGEANGTNLAFAKHFARYLIKEKKYYLTAVYGYVGKLTAMVFDEQTVGRDAAGDRIEAQHKKAHKWSKSDIGLATEKWTKAKEKRERFYGLV